MKKIWIAVAALALAASGCGLGAGQREQTSEGLPALVPVETETEPATIPVKPPDEEISTIASQEETEEEQGERGGTRIVIMTDIHYLAEELTDFGSGFQSMVDHGDGKLTNYVWQITDAALEEVKAEQPDLLILSGDLTLEGEKESHRQLAQKLEEVEKAGVEVVVIPGNHDINNTKAAGYLDTGVYPTELVTPREFAEIYSNFGYDEAVSRDPASLSYTYDVNEDLRLLMLDSCQYEPENQTGGMIKSETYDWIREQLDLADEESMEVLPAAHHNLLDESQVYVLECTIEHSEELIELLEDYNIPLFLSGHLHVQHFMQNRDIGIYEIVTSSLSTPPCQYGVLDYENADSFYYHTEVVDMEGWAKRQDAEDENLLNFSEYGKSELERIFYNEAYRDMKNSREEEPGSIFVKLSETEKKQMAQIYAKTCAAWAAGKAYEIVDEVRKDPGYELWQEHCYPPILAEYMEYIVEDAVRDYNTLEKD